MRDALNWWATILGCVLAVAALAFAWYTYEKSRRAQVQELLDGACDALNGGALGSSWVQHPPALTAQRLSQLEVANRKIRQALVLDESSSRGHDALGLYYFLLGRRPEARREFELSIRYDPTVPDPHCNLGNVYLEWNLTGPAITEFKIARRLSPSYVAAYAGYVSALMRQYDKRARQPDARFLSLPTVSRSGGLIILHYSETDPEVRPPTPTKPEDIAVLDDAANALTTAIGYDKNTAELWRLLGNVRDIQKQTEQAIAAYETAAKLAPEDPYVHFDYGLALMWSGNMQGAHQRFIQAVRISAVYASAWRLLGVTYHHLQQTDRSIAALLESLRLDEHDNAAGSLLKKWYPPNAVDVVRKRAKSGDGAYSAIVFAAEPSP